MIQTINENVAELASIQTVFSSKEVLTFEEASLYMGVSKSHLYKLTMRQEIPHYKPTGKMVYFNRKELEQWLQRNRITPNSEIEQEAQSYCLKNRRK